MNKEQARKLYELADRLSKLDVNTLSEEQLAERSAMIARLQEVKQRLDPKCWKGKHKEGTKIKGGVRVNNCVPNESIEEAGSPAQQAAIAIAKKNKLKEFAPAAGDGGEEETLHKYARMWYNGDMSTQEQVEKVLDRMGWEIGEIESEEGGAFVVQSGDEHGDSYIGFNVADLTEGIAEDADGEYNDEAGMAQSSLKTMSRAVNGLMDTIQQGDNLPEWAQEKLSLAEDYLTTVWDYLLSQKEQGIEPKLEEGSQKVDSLVTDALKLMRGSEVSDAVKALTTVLGNREYNSRRGFYNFYVKQLIDMYGQQGVTETKKPSPKLTPVEMKKTEAVSEEINTEAYERLQKVFAFKNYES